MQKERIWELDALRGFCILCVIVIHFIFDLQYFGGLNLTLPAVYLFIQNNGAILFILVSGICATLGTRSFRRGVIVFACGMLITGVTFAMIRLRLAGQDAMIHFGILHLLGCCMMLYSLFKKLPTALLAILGTVVVVTGYLLLQHTFPVEGLFFLGIRSPSYAAGDYFPLLPFLGWFLLGVVLGRTLYRTKTSRFPVPFASCAPIRFLRLCGRHSLLIYLAHQPLCYALLMLFTTVFGGLS